MSESLTKRLRFVETFQRQAERESERDEFQIGRLKEQQRRRKERVYQILRRLKSDLSTGRIPVHNRFLAYAAQTTHAEGLHNIPYHSAALKALHGDLLKKEGELALVATLYMPEYRPSVIVGVIAAGGLLIGVNSRGDRTCFIDTSKLSLCFGEEAHDMPDGPMAIDVPLSPRWSKDDGPRPEAGFNWHFKFFLENHFGWPKRRGIKAFVAELRRVWSGEGMPEKGSQYLLLGNDAIRKAQYLLQRSGVDLGQVKKLFGVDLSKSISAAA